MLNKALDNIESFCDLFKEELLGNISAGVLIFDQNLNILWMNRYIESFLPELSGSVHNHTSLLSGLSGTDEEFLIMDQIDQLCNGDNIEVDVRSIGPRNIEWLSHHLSPINSGVHEGGWIGYFYDVTEKKNAESKLREYESSDSVHRCVSPGNVTSHDLLNPAMIIEMYANILRQGETDNERLNALNVIEENNAILSDVMNSVTSGLNRSESNFKTIFDKANDSIFIFDLDGKFIEVNEVACKHLGYSRSELLSMNHKDICKNDISTDPLEAPNVIVKEGHTIMEMSYVTKDMRAIPVELRSRVIEYDDRPAILATARDLSERKRADYLSRTNMELKSLYDTKDIFVDVLRHDLLNPAGIIRGYTEVLLHRDLDDLTFKAVDRIRRSNDMMIRLIESASRYAKLESMEDLDFEILDIGDILKIVIDELAPLINERDITVEFETNSAFPAHVNPLVETVFVNYISNAVKYGHERSTVCVDIIDDPDSENMWRIRVSNEGFGIDDEDKPYVFERFKRAHRGNIKGTGLGLAIVKRITNLHGGEVGVYDNPEVKGCVFWASLKKA